MDQDDYKSKTVADVKSQISDDGCEFDTLLTRDNLNTGVIKPRHVVPDTCGPSQDGVDKLVSSAGAESSFEDLDQTVHLTSVKDGPETFEETVYQSSEENENKHFNETKNSSLTDDSEHSDEIVNQLNPESGNFSSENDKHHVSLNIGNERAEEIDIQEFAEAINQDAAKVSKISHKQSMKQDYQETCYFYSNKTSHLGISEGFHFESIKYVSREVEELANLDLCKKSQPKAPDGGNGASKEFVNMFSQTSSSERLNTKNITEVADGSKWDEVKPVNQGSEKDEILGFDDPLKSSEKPIDQNVINDGNLGFETSFDEMVASGTAKDANNSCGKHKNDSSKTKDNTEAEHIILNQALVGRITSAEVQNIGDNEMENVMLALDVGTQPNLEEIDQGSVLPEAPVTRHQNVVAADNQRARSSTDTNFGSAEDQHLFQGKNRIMTQSMRHNIELTGRRFKEAIMASTDLPFYRLFVQNHRHEFILFCQINNNLNQLARYGINIYPTVHLLRPTIVKPPSGNLLEPKSPHLNLNQPEPVSEPRSSSSLLEVHKSLDLKTYSRRRKPLSLQKTYKPTSRLVPLANPGPSNHLLPTQTEFLLPLILPPTTTPQALLTQQSEHQQRSLVLPDTTTSSKQKHDYSRKQDHHMSHSSHHLPRAIRKTSEMLKEEMRATVKANCCVGLKVGDSLGKGKGVFTTQKFAKGSFLCVYEGPVLEQKEGHTTFLNSLPDQACFMFEFSRKGKKLWIDGRDATLGLGRMINHGFNSSNCKPKSTEIDGKPTVYFVASRDLEIGEELLYDYGDKSKEAVEAFDFLKKKPPPKKTSAKYSSKSQ